jgi:hypothetical protein
MPQPAPAAANVFAPPPDARCVRPQDAQAAEACAPATHDAGPHDAGPEPESCC